MLRDKAAIQITRAEVALPTEQRGAKPGARRERPSYVWRLFKVAVAALVAAPVVAFIFGLFLFAATIEEFDSPSPVQRADAIVVLTGGSARISDAVELLERGYAERLLITGVHPDNTAQTLAGSAPSRNLLFACCVDLGYMALNTVGNAKEARNWARSRGYRSLIVVTSIYHLPRSLNELRREMPDAVLIPYAVVSDDLLIREWWRDPATARLLFSEYVKYVSSLLRLRWRPAISPDIGITASVSNE